MIPSETSSLEAVCEEIFGNHLDLDAVAVIGLGLGEGGRIQRI